MARECQYLTVAEKDALLAANPTYSVISGPHDTEEECLAVCNESTGTGTTITPGVEVACCAETLPFNITLTFALTNCTGSFSASWNPVEERYECETTLNTCDSATFYVSCQDGQWYLSGAKNAVASSAVCDPLVITFTIESTGSFARGRNLCGCGDGTITVTE